MRPRQRHARHRRLIGLALTAVLIGGAAQAQPTGRDQKLLDLAYVLGDAHALRQVCSPEDQMWRERMRRMLEVEAPSEALEAQMSARFNTGYADAKRRFPKCAPGAGKAEAAVASQGRKLAEALAETS